MHPFRRRGLLGGTLAVAGMLPLARFARAQEEKQVNVYNWDTYIGSDTLAEFTDATGIDVRYDLYASSDELFGKLREGNPGYDVIFPSNNYLERMVVSDMLIPLDHALIPNLKNISPAFNNPSYDPGLKYGAPYTYSLLAIGYRRSAVAEPPTSWAAVFGPDAPKGRVSLPNETDLVRAALKYLGKSLNTDDPANLKAAEDLLLEVKKRGVVKMFAPDTGQDLLLSGEVDLAVDWMGDFRQVMAEDDDLDFVVPSEGTVLGIDCMCIPASGQCARLHRLRAAPGGACRDRRGDPVRDPEPGGCGAPARGSPQRPAGLPAPGRPREVGSARLQGREGGEDVRGRAHPRSRGLTGCGASFQWVR
jgi:spermidine/putrescine transport system substrate-binding protein